MDEFEEIMGRAGRTKDSFDALLFIIIVSWMVLFPALAIWVWRWAV